MLHVCERNGWKKSHQSKFSWGWIEKIKKHHVAWSVETKAAVALENSS